jgi:hypothetical protein
MTALNAKSPRREVSGSVTNSGIPGVSLATRRLCLSKQYRDYLRKLQRRQIRSASTRLRVLREVFVPRLCLEMSLLAI